MRTAIILAPDDSRLLTAFGMPLARRLTIVASKMSIERFFVIGKVDSLIPILSDLVPLRNFYSLESGDLLQEVIELLDIKRLYSHVLAGVLRTTVTQFYIDSLNVIRLA